MDLSSFKEKTVTVGQLLQAQQDLEQEAQDVLGFNIDDCTHSRGNICQTVYSCLTCQRTSGDRAGICAACSIQCHGDHDLVELLQRRHFQCDCGTIRLGDEADCRLDKRYAQDANTGNSYDHNFDGTFCVCKMQYDPEKEESDMFQCTVCEDWFHKRCTMDNLQLEDDEWDQFVCSSCATTGRGARLFQRWAGQPGSGVLLITDDGAVRGRLSEKATKRAASEGAVEPEAKKPKLENGTLASLPDVPSSTVPADVVDQRCKAPPPPAASSTPIGGPLLLEEGWRDRWCRCAECLPAFDGLPFLLEADEVFEPGEDPAAGRSLVDLGIEALERLPREKVIEGLHRYSKMRDGLLEYLAPLSATDQVVTKEMIDDFFEKQRASRS